MSRHARIPEGIGRRLGELTKREIQVYICLLMHRNEQTGACNPSRKTIASATLITDRANLSRALAGLGQKGWINETPDGFILLLNRQQNVVKSTTETDESCCQIDNKMLSDRQQKVVKSTTDKNKGFKQRIEQRIEHRSIDGIVSDCADTFPTTDRRLIEIGILQTFLTRNGSKEPINSIAYFSPEIEKVSATKVSGKMLDAILQARREKYKNLLDAWAK